jgi:hypothetical protein
MRVCVRVSVLACARARLRAAAHPEHLRILRLGALARVPVRDVVSEHVVLRNRRKPGARAFAFGPACLFASGFMC